MSHNWESQRVRSHLRQTLYTKNHFNNSIYFNTTTILSPGTYFFAKFKMCLIFMPVDAYTCDVHYISQLYEWELVKALKLIHQDQAIFFSKLHRGWFKETRLLRFRGTGSKVFWQFLELKFSSLESTLRFWDWEGVFKVLVLRLK